MKSEAYWEKKGEEAGRKALAELLTKGKGDVKASQGAIFCGPLVNKNVDK